MKIFSQKIFSIDKLKLATKIVITYYVLNNFSINCAAVTEPFLEKSLRVKKILKRFNLHNQNRLMNFGKGVFTLNRLMSFEKGNSHNLNQLMNFEKMYFYII